MRVLEALTQVFVPPYQVTQNAVNQEWTFGMGHFPSEIDSEEEPPIRLGKNVEMIPIDGLLGQYSPATIQITVFRKGIQLVADITKLREHDLLYIVRLHEWAHALMHVGLERQERERLTLDESLWPTYLNLATAGYLRLDGALHERLAQLLVWYGLQGMGQAATVPEAKVALVRIGEAFKTLTHRCPLEYQIDDYLQIPRPRILQSVRLLKNMGINGFEAWDTVIRW
ncbi:MAG: hypothetical protein HY316_09930 [Acidobacteria bacterium]|nr:hypothetical protein [Acidobacteriota bacterium]